MQNSTEDVICVFWPIWTGNMIATPSWMVHRMLSRNFDTVAKFGLMFIMVVFWVKPAKADPMDQTTYTFIFTGSGLPTAGSFTYDPDTATFSAFTVTWDGLLFDFTSSSNASTGAGPFAPCIGGETGAAARFNLLVACQVDPTTFWDATVFSIGPSQSFAQFVFYVPSQGPSQSPLPIHTSLILPALPSTSGHGAWAVTSAPEPSSLILLFTMVAGAFMARKRMARARPTARK